MTGSQVHTLNPTDPAPGITLVEQHGGQKADPRDRVGSDKYPPCRCHVEVTMENREQGTPALHIFKDI